MEKQVRLAEITLRAVKKRCRKEQLIFIEGIGDTDKEALTNLLIEFKKEMQSIKSFSYKGKILIINAIKRNCQFGHSIERLVYFGQSLGEEENPVFIEPKEFFPV